MRVSFEGVTVVLGRHTACDRVDLTVEHGERLVLLGPNGSGKSTLLRSLYRFLRPRLGTVRVNGDDVWSLRERESARRTAVVVQEPVTDFSFRVREVVALGRLPHQLIWAPDAAVDGVVVEAALARVGMTAYRDRDIRTLSGGEKQRVLIARALAQQAQVLVMDEPTNHLDIHYQLQILELVRNLGITTVVAMHDINLAARYGDRLALLRRGRIVAAGRPIEVLDPRLIAEVFQVEAEPVANSAGCPAFLFWPIRPRDP